MIKLAFKKQFCNPILMLATIILLLSCSSRDKKHSDDVGTVRKLPANMQYSFDCLQTDSSQITDALQKADDVLGKLVTYNIDVTDQEQMRFGDSVLQQSVASGEFILDTIHPSLPRLQKIVNHLVAQRHNPSAINYQVFVLTQDSSINAFTVGGKIFITTAMLQAVQNTDQLYAILGHEIGHNEKGHISKTIKQLKAGKKYLGNWGQTVVALKKMLTGSFNHRNELEADYYGLDLTWKAGYDICAIKSFWDNMSAGEEQAGWLDFFRTHPYSNIRSKCLQKHISSNFKQSCSP